MGVLARLRESGGVEYAALDERAARGALAALSIVDPKRVDGETDCEDQPAGE